MGRRRDHHPRDNTVCPDAEACARFGHYAGVFEGDACECCGQLVVGETRYIVVEHEKYPDWWRVYDTKTNSWPGIVHGRHIKAGTREIAQAEADWLNGQDS